MGKIVEPKHEFHKDDNNYGNKNLSMDTDYYKLCIYYSYTWFYFCRNGMG